MEGSLGFIDGRGKLCDERYYLTLDFEEYLAKAGVACVGFWSQRCFSSSPAARPFREECGPTLVQLCGVCDTSAGNPWFLHSVTAAISPFKGRSAYDRLCLSLYRVDEPTTPALESGSEIQSAQWNVIEKDRSEEELIPLGVSREDLERRDGRVIKLGPYSSWNVSRSEGAELLAKAGVLSSLDVLELVAYASNEPRQLFRATVQDILATNYRMAFEAQLQWNLLADSIPKGTSLTAPSRYKERN